MGKREDLAPDHARDIDDVERAVARHAGIDGLLVETEPAEMLHRAHADRDRTRMLLHYRQRLDQQAPHAAPGEIEREGEADRSGAGNQDGCSLHAVQLITPG